MRYDPTMVTRRRVITISTAMAGAFAFRGAARAGEPPEEIDLEEFADAWRSAAEVVLDAPHAEEDRYLHRLCGLVLSLDRADVPRMKRPGFERDGLKSGPAWGDGEIMVVEIRLAPGAVIPAHNHVGYSFVTMGLEGECEYRHYEPLDAPPAIASGRSADFDVRETRAGVLTPGRLTHLSRVRDNIHWFRAGDEGATLIDFGTHYRSPGDGYRTFSALDVDPEAVAPGARRFRGRWIGNPYREE